MGIDAIDHLYLETRRFEEALGFWQALGFAVESSWGGAGHRACLLRAGRAAVVLAEADPGRAPRRPTAHFAVAGPQALAERLATSPQVRVVTPLEPTHWGTRWIRVEDPEGNLFCLEETG